MITADSCFLEMISSPVRRLKARLELYENGNSTLLNTFYYTDRLKSLTIERVGDESKFFGFGVCQKLNVKLIDKNRELNITTANNFEVVFGAEYNYIYTCPIFHVTEVHRDENTNELSVTAYDRLYEAKEHQVSELNIPSPCTIKDYAIACANFLGLPMNIINAESSFMTEYETTANFEGTESIREALNAIAEATQTIYYIDSNWELTFKRLDMSGEPVLMIDKEKYFTLKSSDNRRLSTVCHATELGDNVSASITKAGTTQYVRDNPFWEMRDDIATLVDNALAAVGGLTINQFNCNWRGNFLVEIGDKIALTTKDNETVYSYLLDDTISYDGSYSQKTQWSYKGDNAETISNPTSLGDAIKQTYARVDKANKNIELVASETKANTDNISSLLLNTDSLAATVQRIEETTNSALDSVNGEISTLTNRVNATLTAEDVTLSIQSELANGVSKVTTATGFTFNNEGLKVEKTGSEMSTKITENGMMVYKDKKEVLTANNVGVDAVNLHATTYLIIGTNSRFEDYGKNRTGCFWIGG